MKEIYPTLKYGATTWLIPKSCFMFPVKLVEFVKDRETKEPATKLVADLIQNAIQKGLFLESCGTASNTVRFLAPLTMTDEQMERGLEIFEEALKEALEA